MAYLGRGLDKISNIEVLDNITFDGSSSYSITKGSVAFTPNSAQSCLISIDGVVQATNFTVSSSTIDFGVAIPSTSTCNFFLHYGTGVMTVPSDGSVTLDKLSATGTKNATTFLRGDNTFNAVGVSNGFHAYDMASNSSGDLVLNTELFDDGGNYNTSNGRYTAPSDGKYFFSTSAIATGTGGRIIFKKNGSNLAGGTDMFGYSPDNATQGTATLIINLSANDYINVNAQNTVYSNYIFFNGVKLY